MLSTSYVPLPTRIVALVSVQTSSYDWTPHPCGSPCRRKGYDTLLKPPQEKGWQTTWCRPSTSATRTANTDNKIKARRKVVGRWDEADIAMAGRFALHRTANQRMRQRWVSSYQSHHSCSSRGAINHYLCEKTAILALHDCDTTDFWLRNLSFSFLFFGPHAPFDGTEEKTNKFNRSIEV